MKTKYGNHSCRDCAVKRCPISNYSNKPNSCSYYWPPSATGKPGLGYYQSLNRVAKERNKAHKIDH